MNQSVSTSQLRGRNDIWSSLVGSADCEVCGSVCDRTATVNLTRRLALFIGKIGSLTSNTLWRSIITHCRSIPGGMQQVRLLHTVLLLKMPLSAACLSSFAFIAAKKFIVDCGVSGYIISWSSPSGIALVGRCRGGYYE